jgi:TRAP-type uncharacterized transport system substrate-binding protein
MEAPPKQGMQRVLAPFIELFGLSRTAALFVVLFVAAVLFLAIFWFFYSAPPKRIIITTGAAGSTFETNAIRYSRALASNGVTLQILSSEGSLQNLQRLSDPQYPVQVGFIQSGMTNRPDGRKLFSLGSISFQPLLIFYRNPTPLALLSDFKGKRLAIGPAGSGTHSLALSLLALNGITPGGSTTLLELEAAETAKALLEGQVDAAFLMGDSAPTQLMRQLLQTPGIELYDFTQADAYTRRLSYLNKLIFPRGAIDFGKNIPSHDISLIAPTIELIAVQNLHPALIDLLLEAAQNVHGTASIFKRKGEFPSPIEHDFPISAEAARYYKSGKSFLYRYLPFWLASVINRFVVAFIPALVVLIPALRMLPTLLRLRVRLQLYRWYRALLAIDKELRQNPDNRKRAQLLATLGEIEKGAHRMKVPASAGDQFYVLRSHIDLVRQHLTKVSP